MLSVLSVGPIDSSIGGLWILGPSGWPGNKHKFTMVDVYQTFPNIFQPKGNEIKVNQLKIDEATISQNLLSNHGMLKFTMVARKSGKGPGDRIGVFFSRKNRGRLRLKAIAHVET